MPLRKYCRKQTGLTLIDLMVALVLFSIGVLGMVGMQATMTQTSVVSEERVTASTLADELVADIQMYGGNVPAAVQTAWQNKVTSQLPAGAVTTVPAFPLAALPAAPATTISVTINWTPPSRTKAGSQANQYVTEVTYP
ncbi:MAG: type IV pilus modification PilV family protein [Stenotrophobium sp.]